MNDMHQFVSDPFVLGVPLALLIGTIVLGLVARRIVFRLIQGWAKRTDSQLDVLLINTLRGPVALWIVILGLHLSGGSFAWLGILAVLIGAGTLILNVPDGPPRDSGDDDGAVV